VKYFELFKGIHIPLMAVSIQIKASYNPQEMKDATKIILCEALLPARK
jgi:hypothetical protein